MIVKKVSKPNFTLGEAEHNFLNYLGRQMLALVLMRMQLLYQHGYVLLRII